MQQQVAVELAALQAYLEGAFIPWSGWLPCDQLTVVEGGREVDQLWISLGKQAHLWVRSSRTDLVLDQEGAQRKTRLAPAIERFCERYLARMRDPYTRMEREALLAQVGLGERAALEALCRQHATDGSLMAMALSPCGRYLALAAWSAGRQEDEGATGTVEVREVETWRLVSAYSGHSRGVCALAWSPDSRWVVSASMGGDDRSAHVWQAATGRQHVVYAAHSDGLQCVDVEPGGEYAVTAGFDGLVHVWRLSTGEPVQAFDQHRSVTCVAFSPDGARIASGDFGGCVRIWPLLAPRTLDAAGARGVTQPHPPTLWD